MERFTISLDSDLAAAFDGWIAERGYGNRSEAVRDLLRGELERALTESGRATHCVACLSYVYNHHERELAGRLNAQQHVHHDLIVSSMHAHLDHDHCLETVILRGGIAAVRGLADALCAERGVRHGKLNLISVDEGPAHRHPPAAGERRHAPGAVPSAPHRHAKPSV